MRNLRARERRFDRFSRRWPSWRTWQSQDPTEYPRPGPRRCRDPPRGQSARPRPRRQVVLSKHRPLEAHSGGQDFRSVATGSSSVSRRGGSAAARAPLRRRCPRRRPARRGTRPSPSSAAGAPACTTARGPPRRCAGPSSRGARGRGIGRATTPGARSGAPRCIAAASGPVDATEVDRFRRFLRRRPADASLWWKVVAKPRPTRFSAIEFRARSALLAAASPRGPRGRSTRRPRRRRDFALGL